MATVIVCLVNTILVVTVGLNQTKFFRETLTLARIAILPFIWIKTDLSLSEYVVERISKSNGCCCSA